MDIKQRLFTVLIVFLLVFTTTLLPAHAESSLPFNLKTPGTKNSRENPYIIDSANALLTLSAASEKDSFDNVYFALGSDINLEGVKFTPIGKKTAFKGVFDGKGYKITGLKISEGDYNGLFGRVNGGSITNLTVSGDITAVLNGTFDKAATGGIVGEASDAYIENCAFFGAVDINTTAAASSVGGICGNAERTLISACENYASITVNAGDGSAVVSVGGVVGEANGSSELINCMNGGTAVVASASDKGFVYLGGLAGTLTGGSAARNSYSAVSVAASGGEECAAGILVGYLAAKIENCYGSRSSSAQGASQINSGGGPLGKTGDGYSIRHCYWPDSALYKEVYPDCAYFIDSDGRLNPAGGVFVGNVKRTKLLDALNGWVDSFGGEYGARSWVKTEANSGYPVFGKSSRYMVMVPDNIAGGNIYAESTLASEGDIITLSVVPFDGYALKEGSLSVGNAEILQENGVYSFVMPAGNVAINAEFEYIIIHTYSINIQPPQSGGFITAQPEAVEGEEVVVTVTPEYGKRLTAGGLKCNGSVVNKTVDGYLFVMPPSEVEITAEFESIPGDIGNDVRVKRLSGGELYFYPDIAAEGEIVTVTVKPLDGYIYRDSSLKYNGTPVRASGGVYSFAMPSGSVVIDAEFVRLGAGEFTIKPSERIAGGFVSVLPSAAPAGALVTVTATPDSGYVLLEGSLKYNNIPIALSGGAYRFNMPAENVIVTAEFIRDKAKKYSIKIELSDGGRVSASLSGAEAGTKINVAYMTDDGYRLAEDSLKYNSVMLKTDENGGYYFIMPETDVTITAIFEKNIASGGNTNQTDMKDVGLVYSVSIVSSVGGRIVKIGENDKGDVSFSITPDKGYVVSDVKVNNTSVGALNIYTFEQINGDHTIEALFVKDSVAEDIWQLKDLMTKITVTVVGAAALIAGIAAMIFVVNKKRKNKKLKQDLKLFEDESHFGEENHYYDEPDDEYIDEQPQHDSFDGEQPDSEYYKDETPDQEQENHPDAEQQENTYYDNEQTQVFERSDDSQPDD